MHKHYKKHIFHIYNKTFFVKKEIITNDKFKVYMQGLPIQEPALSWDIKNGKIQCVMANDCLNESCGGKKKKKKKFHI